MPLNVYTALTYMWTKVFAGRIFRYFDLYTIPMNTPKNMVFGVGVAAYGRNIIHFETQTDQLEPPVEKLGWTNMNRECWRH